MLLAIGEQNPAATPTMARISIHSLLRSPRNYQFRRAALALLAALMAVPSGAKDAHLIAIELYNGPNGPAYVQISDVLINGKIELRLCGSDPKIDKSSYGKLNKVTLSIGATLEYGITGGLTLSTGKSRTCVVPSNLKYEKNQSSTPQELAALSDLHGNLISPTAGGSA